ncbi:hypothetical protein [Streptomyces sp. HUAS TT7]|uniref:hypothetical protein n=1 Tax=Streptomyces sp. HUAS TT7 TaxID=3447507 RepID=UPI003F6566AC
MHDELRKAGLPACRATIDDRSPGARIDVDDFEDGPGVWGYWNCDPSLHAAFDMSRPGQGLAFQYFVQAAGHVQTAVLGILMAAGFIVERDDQDPLVLLIWPGRAA